VGITLVRVEKITLVRVFIADIYIFFKPSLEGGLMLWCLLRKELTGEELYGEDLSENIVRERIVRRRIDFEKNCL
jgi:hypothetical protein